MGIDLNGGGGGGHDRFWHDKGDSETKKNIKWLNYFKIIIALKYNRYITIFNYFQKLEVVSSWMRMKSLPYALKLLVINTKRNH